MSNKDLIKRIFEIIELIKRDEEKLKTAYDILAERFLENRAEGSNDDEIPEKFRSVVKEIADLLTADTVCFLNPLTLEFDFVPQLLLNDPDEYEALTGGTAEDWNTALINVRNNIRIEPPESFESYKFMESFASTITDGSFRDKLFNALEGRKPFANFKRLVENSGYRQQWFDHRQKKLEEYVFRIIETDK